MRRHIPSYRYNVGQGVSREYLPILLLAKENVFGYKLVHFNSHTFHFLLWIIFCGILCGIQEQRIGWVQVYLYLSTYLSVHIQKNKSTVNPAHLTYCLINDAIPYLPTNLCLKIAPPITSIDRQQVVGMREECRKLTYLSFNTGEL